MAIAYIGRTTQYGNAAAFNHTTTAETTGLIIVNACRTQNVNQSPTKFNDVNLTEVLTAWGAGGYWRTSVHYMQNPPIGLYHVDVTNGDANNGVSTCINVSGILLVGDPVRYSDSHPGSDDPMTAHFTSLVGDIIIDVITVGETSWHPNSGQTTIDSAWWGATPALYGCSYYLGALTDPSWHRGVPNDGSYISVDFKPNPVAGCSPMWWF